MDSHRISAAIERLEGRFRKEAVSAAARALPMAILMGTTALTAEAAPKTRKSTPISPAPEIRKAEVLKAATADEDGGIVMEPADIEKPAAESILPAADGSMGTTADPAPAESPGTPGRPAGSLPPAGHEPPLPKTDDNHTEVTPSGLWPSGEGAVDASQGLQDAADTRLAAPKRIQLTLSGGVLYDSNIFLTPKDQTSDILYRLSPAIALSFGDAKARQETYATASYRADGLVFQDSSDQNTVDHDLQVSGMKKFSRLSVGVDGRAQKLSGSTVDLGTRAERLAFNAALRLTYGWGERTSVDTALLWEATRYDSGQFTDSDQWTHETFFDYLLAPKAHLAAGFAWGQLDVAGPLGGKQDFQRALLRGRWEMSDKFSLNARAGLEWRQFASSDSTTPIFGLGASWKPREGTEVTLNGERVVEASGSEAGQNYTRSGVSVGLAQRVGDRFILGLSGGWAAYQYETVKAAPTSDKSGTTAAPAVARDVDDFSVRPSLAYKFRDDRTAEIWYQFRADRSGGDLDYDVNQLGFNFRVDF